MRMLEDHIRVNPECLHLIRRLEPQGGSGLLNLFIGGAVDKVEGGAERICARDAKPSSWHHCKGEEQPIELRCTCSLDGLLRRNSCCR